MPIKLKRAYEDAAKDDGMRILVDRVWPRGVSKEQLSIDHWMKEIAPSNELRKWFNHDPDKFVPFKQKYKEELFSDEEKYSQFESLKELITSHKGNITLVYGAKDEKHNQAVALKEMLEC